MKHVRTAILGEIQIGVRLWEKGQLSLFGHYPEDVHSMPDYRPDKVRSVTESLQQPLEDAASRSN